jgi:hypothetical protein
MGTAITRPVNFVEGRDYPSPVTHVIGFGYHDGVTDGVLKTADDSVYRFDLVGEQFNPVGLDRRTFSLAPLPPGAFDAILALLEPHMTPRWPCWVPIWRFPTEAVQRGVETEVGRLLAAVGSPAWRVEATDLTETVSATPLG